MTVTDPPPPPDERAVKTQGSQLGLDALVGFLVGLFGIIGIPIKGLYQQIGSAYVTAATVLGLCGLGGVFVYIENMPEPLADPNADVHRARSEEGLKADVWRTLQAEQSYRTDQWRQQLAYEQFVKVFFENEKTKLELGIDKPEQEPE